MKIIITVFSMFALFALALNVRQPFKGLIMFFLLAVGAGLMIGAIMTFIVFHFAETEKLIYL